MITQIKVCLNGGRRRVEHPAVPITTTELAEAAAAAVAAGAEAVHLHPRGGDGNESLRSGDVAAAVAAVRQACPGVEIGVSTGLWICNGDVQSREAMVTRWALIPSFERPDFASANVSEPGFAELVGLLREAGIAVEAGVWSTADARKLAATESAAGWARILTEIINVPADGAVEAADEILQNLDELGVEGPRLLHGEEAACWPLVAHAGRLGVPTRIGLEDTIVGPGGEPVPDNADLVRLARAVWTAANEGRR